MLPEFEVVAADALTTIDREQIIALCSDAYQEDFRSLFETLPGSTHVLAVLDGRLVSHACWVTRWLEPAGLAALRTAYVEAVATCPHHQRRGFASLVMRRVAREIAGYQLGALSPSAPVFYERLGWERWRGQTAIRTARGLLNTTGEQVMIYRTPLTPPLDLDALLTAEWRVGELW